MKNILIAGANSYIGKAFNAFIRQYQDEYTVRDIATKGLIPTADMFVEVDVVFCVVGIAHIKETSKNRNLYFEVNCDLVVAIARAAKKAGVKQFILLSSMSVYGLKVGHIRKITKPHPVNAYGESKFGADKEIKKLESDDFKFTCLRTPMVYGKNCRGNYQTLRKFALKSPIFPDYDNQRSMIYIGNLCEFVKECIDYERQGVFFPQNKEYTNTSRMVELIAQAHGKKIKKTRIFNWLLKTVPLGIVKKVFGNLTYEAVDMVEKYGFEESIKLTEE